jgi:SAM-dependent methyltransferase
MHDNEIRRTYDELHLRSELRFPKEDYAVFFQWLNVPLDSASLSLLDIACGQGFFLEAAEQQTTAMRLEGIDFSPVGLAKASERVRRARLTEGSAYALPHPDESFDYVTNLGSLEHFTRPVDALREMGRVLKSTGKGVLIVPNRYYLGNIWQVYAYGEEDNQGQEGICHFNTGRGWDTLIRSAGLDPIAVRGYNGEDHIAWYFKRRNPTEITPYERAYREVLETFVKPGIPLNLSQCFVFFVRRQPI